MSRDPRPSRRAFLFGRRGAVPASSRKGNFSVSDFYRKRRRDGSAGQWPAPFELRAGLEARPIATTTTGVPGKRRRR